MCVCTSDFFHSTFFFSSYITSLLIHYIYDPAICCSQSTCSCKIGENFPIESADYIWGKFILSELNLGSFFYQEGDLTFIITVPEHQIMNRTSMSHCFAASRPCLLWKQNFSQRAYFFSLCFNDFFDYLHLMTIKFTMIFLF